MPPRCCLFFVLVFTAFLTVLVMMPSGARASEVRLAWQRNPETNVIGYRVYYGYSSGSYKYRLNVGNRIAYILKGLPVGKKCYIAVAAYDFYGNESTLSKEISYTPPAPITLGAETFSLASPVVLVSDEVASGGNYIFGSL